MKVETYKCDVCGKQKGETNHWWVSYEIPNAIDTDRGFTLWPWPNSISSKDVLHLCGQSCVLRKVTEFMEAK